MNSLVHSFPQYRELLIFFYIQMYSIMNQQMDSFGRDIKVPVYKYTEY